MRKNEDGEFELVVGNQQLLMVLVVMFSLFGVVFSMGYFVGRSTAPDSASPAAGEARPATADNRAPAAGLTPPGAEPQVAPQQPAAPDVPLAPGQAKVTTPVATEPVKTEPPAATPIPEFKQPPTPSPAPPAKPPAEKRIPAAPEPGQTYLQVAAVGKPEAELVVDVLRKRGFSALVAPVPNSTKWRTLVGPLPDAPAISKARTDLQAAGFKDVIVRKY
ncbi:MAG: SPOR domain-containing protein [Bryobacteraceae bacterium]